MLTSLDLCHLLPASYNEPHRLHPAPLEMVGIADTFAESGPYRELLARYGLTAEHIVKAAHRALQRKE